MNDGYVEVLISVPLELIPLVEPLMKRARAYAWIGPGVIAYDGLGADINDFNRKLPEGLRCELGQPVFGGRIRRYVIRYV